MHDVKSYEIESSSMPRWETNGVFFVLNQTIQKFALSELMKWRFWSPFTAM